MYLALGMTYELYWDGDNSLPKAYRDAKKIRDQDRNYWTWLQGMYVYDAISRLSPALRAFSKGKPEKYPAEPYPITAQAAKAAEDKKAKAQQSKGIAYMESKMAAVNMKFQKGSEEIANDNRGLESQRKE